MRQGNRIGLLALVLALTALVGAQGASASTLEVGGVGREEATNFTMSLAAETSLMMETTTESVVNTCTSSHLAGETFSPYHGTQLGVWVTALVFTGCKSNVEVLKAGIFNVEFVSGTTNGTVRWEGFEAKVSSPLGTLTCKTETSGGGTHIGTLTGTGDVKEHATFDMDAILNCGTQPSVRWRGTYAVTGPTGVGVTDVPTALEVSGSTKDESVEITGSLAAGSSLALKFGSFVLNTCTESHLHGATTAPFTRAPLAAQIETLAFGGCGKEPVIVHNAGVLTVKNLGTTNGTVHWVGAEVTFPVSSSGTAVCRTATGDGTHIGVLKGTGNAEGHATLEIDAVVGCLPFPSLRLQGTYTITSPTGLGVTS